MRELIGASYASPTPPLVVRFSDDSIDESPALERALPTACGFRSAPLRGTHLTPLALDPAAGPLPLPEGGPFDARRVLLADFDALVDAIEEHFDTVVAPAAHAAAPVDVSTDTTAPVEEAA